MQEFETIYLSWRKGAGSSRFLVGKIELQEGNSASFSYNKSEVEAAKQEGFSAYTEFQNIDGVYTQNVIDIFAQRLTKSVRPDIQAFYDFWEIDAAKTSDKAYLLAHTQGLLTTDNFEFLADYNPISGLRFLTDLAFVSGQNNLPGTVVVGDELTIEKEPTNSFDKYAVIAMKSGITIGYLKKVHCHLFHKPGAETLKLTVKAIEKNGKIKRVFATVAQTT